MRLLFVMILILMMGCSSSGVYKVRIPEQRMVGVAVSINSLISVIHPLHLGQELEVFIRGRWIKVKVIRIGYNGIVELIGVDEDLNLQPRDCGSPVVAIIIGKRKKP